MISVSKCRYVDTAYACNLGSINPFITRWLRPSTHRLNRQSRTAACFMHVHQQARTYCTHRSRTSTQPATSKFQISSRKKLNIRWRFTTLRRTKTRKRRRVAAPDNVRRCTKRRRQCYRFVFDNVQRQTVVGHD